MTLKYTHKFKCLYQKCPFDAITGNPLHPPYCEHSTYPERKGKITCHYLGKCVEMIIGDKKTKVNLCDFVDDSG
ncbi:MAG: hypothetical protein N3G19_00040 [Candidatus Pacearchaeota archaeon]|nr:hypothetical protein [Candidatus Pacearchaeota archaeon]